jgi:hypothetical protein
MCCKVIFVSLQGAPMAPMGAQSGFQQPGMASGFQQPMVVRNQMGWRYLINAI